MKSTENPPSQLLSANKFQLVRYFTLTSLVMFLLVALAVTYFMRQQGEVLRSIQAQEAEFFTQVQRDFAKQQDEVARRDLLTVHESGNVNLTRLFANALWQHDFAPFVARAAQIPVDQCHAIDNVIDPKDGKAKPPAEKKACFAEVGKKIMALPGYDALNAKVFDSMKKSTVFKIKVFDLRGVTIYSSERSQVGEDKLGNAGWKQAAREGKPASEMTHRDKFSAFEGVVEKRDLISSYLPVLAPGTDQIVGVFEVYSDVTPFLNQIKATSAKIAQTTADNQLRSAKMSEQNEARMAEIGNSTVAIVAGLMVMLFAALYFIVRRADKIMVQQTREREMAQQHLAQSEKMASLGQMVAGVAHQLNTPIAFSHSNVSMAMDAIKAYELPLNVAGKFTELVKKSPSDRVVVNVSRARGRLGSIDASDLDTLTPTEMLGDTLQGLDQMRELVQNLRDFTRLDRSKTARTDLNKGLHTVVYIAKSVIPTHITVVEDYAQLPEVECNVSQLNQVFLNLINNAAQAINAEGGTITVRTRLEQGHVCVEVTDTGSGIAPEVLPHIWDNYYTTKAAGEGTGLGLPIAKSIVEQHGGEISVKTQAGAGSTFTVRLPAMVGETVAA